MRSEKRIKKVGYGTLAALLTLVFWSYWVSYRVQRGEQPVFLSDGVATAISDACTVIAYIAVGCAVFIVVRAFYLGLTEPESKGKHDHNG